MKRKDKPRTYEKPISLHPLSFNEAIDKLLIGKPEKRQKPKGKPSSSTNSSKKPKK